MNLLSKEELKFMKTASIAFGVFVVGVFCTGLILSYFGQSMMCSARWESTGAKTSYGPLKGCQIIIFEDGKGKQVSVPEKNIVFPLM